MRSTVPTLSRLAFVLALGSCGNLTCDQDKQQSIEHMNLGVEAANEQAFQTAEKEFKTAADLDPTNHLAAYQLGQVLVKQEKWDKAAEALSTAVKFNDGDPMYHYHLGHAYLELNRLDMARTELEKAISLQKRLFKAHYHLGRVHEKQDRPREAAASWTESCKLNPGFGKPFYDLGKLYYLWDYHQEAATVLVQGAQYARDPEDITDIHYQLGMTYDALKQYDKAVEAFQKAIDAKKDNLLARYQLGLAYANKGDKPQAMDNLTEFTKVAGSNPELAPSVQAAYDRLNRLRAE